ISSSFTADVPKSIPMYSIAALPFYVSYLLSMILAVRKKIKPYLSFVPTCSETGGPKPVSFAFSAVIA
ncbi:MAG: hypothetical protein NC123_05600, partial [Butyrivibrio sp.]|nr:hypothetical protein [Acetatifactor muris]MCM1559003.1 hypothetical protein [Butyrivibrio sp.]